MKLLFELDKKNYDPNGKVVVRPSARGIIFKDGKLSVIYSRKKQFCKIPGGGIETGEDIAEAMIREVREEVGLVVIPDTIREFGYVHRAQKEREGGIFIQDNYYFFCEAEDEVLEPEYTSSEQKEDFVPMFLELEEVIRINEAFQKNFPDNVMVDRELRILYMIRDMRK